MRVFTPVLIFACCIIPVGSAAQNPQPRPSRPTNVLGQFRLAGAHRPSGSTRVTQEIARSQRANTREHKANQTLDARAESRRDVVPLLRREIQDSIEDAKVLSREQTRKSIKELKHDEVRLR